MCGIAGFSGRKGLTPQQAKLATNKMKILGLFNQSRGVHGCGLYVNGEVYKGIDDVVNKKNTKEFASFISNLDFVWPEFDPKKGNIMFLHTRMATTGAHTEANTHPFTIKSKNPVDNLIGVHNGTLDNAWSLCHKYGVDHMGEHINVDSKALYTLIDRVGLDILKEYDGAAALLWTKPSDPHTLRVFHGATRKTHKDPLTYEERPMHYMETEEGIYFSSMPNSLLAIRESLDQKVIELRFNVVFEVTNGKFTKNEIFIDRADANLKADITPIRYPVHVPSTDTSYRRTNNNFQNLRTIVDEVNRTEELSRQRKGAKPHKNLNVPKFSLIWYETKPAKAVSTRNNEIVYFQHGRYQRSSGDLLCRGLLWIKDRGVIGAEGEAGVEPFWFYHGVMLKNEAAYAALVLEANMPDSWVNKTNSDNYAYDISRFAKHAVTHLMSESIESEDYFRFSFYLDERRVTSKMRPLFSGRCYDIQDGFLVDIIGSNGDDKITTENLPKQEEEKFDTCTVLNNGCGASPKSVRVERSTSVYDVVYTKMKTVFDTLSLEEVHALALFMEDQLKAEGRPHTTEHVQAELWTAVRTGVAMGKSIRDSVGDVTSSLESYYEMVMDKAVDAIKNGEPEPFFPLSIDSLQDAETHVMKRTREYYESFHGGEDDDDNTPFPGGKSIDSYHTKDDEAIHDDWIDDGIDEAHRIEVTSEIEAAYSKHKAKRDILETAEKEVEKKVDEVVGYLGDISTIADELQANDCDFAQESAFCLYNGLKIVKNSLVDVCDKFHRGELIRVMNMSISV